jgi:hypothetical protein
MKFIIIMKMKQTGNFCEPKAKANDMRYTFNHKIKNQYLDKNVINSSSSESIVYDI